MNSSSVPGARHVAIDLPEVALAADRVGEPDRAAAEGAALEAVEAGAALGKGVVVDVGRVDRPPHDPQAPPRVGEVHVSQRRLLDRQGLQLAPGLKRALAGAGIVGDEAVEEGRARVAGRIGLVDLAAEVVLGQIDDAGARVDRQRLVREEAHLADRGARELVLGACRVDLEDVAVALDREAAGEVLLAGEPGAPWRRAAGAVVDRARWRRRTGRSPCGRRRRRSRSCRPGSRCRTAACPRPAVPFRRRARGCGPGPCPRPARRTPRPVGMARHRHARSAAGRPRTPAPGTGSPVAGRAGRRGPAAGRRSAPPACCARRFRPPG